MQIILHLIIFEREGFNDDLFVYLKRIPWLRKDQFYAEYMELIFLWPGRELDEQLNWIYYFILKRKKKADSSYAWVGVMWELLNYFTYGIIFKLIIIILIIIIIMKIGSIFFASFIWKWIYSWLFPILLGML